MKKSTHQNYHQKVQQNVKRGMISFVEFMEIIENEKFLLRKVKICSKGVFMTWFNMASIFFHTKFLICFLLCWVSIFKMALQFRKKKNREQPI